MDIAGLYVHPALILAGVAYIIWMVRLEGRINQDGKDIARLCEDIKRVEKESTKTNEETHQLLKELQKSVTELNVEIVKVISEIKHIGKSDK